MNPRCNLSGLRFLVMIPLVIVLSVSSSKPCYSQKNLTFLDTLTYSQELSDIWGYVDTTGKEYALVGGRNGVSIVDVSTPSNAKEVKYYPGPSTTWRDLKTWNKHVYITNEASGGMMIIDLTPLPDTNLTVTYFTGSTYPFQSAHNLYIDENGICYIFGSDYLAGGAIILDLTADPKNPVELGVFNQYYIHDGIVRGDTLWASMVNSGFFAAVNVTDKANPDTLATYLTGPPTLTHNCWISDDGNTLFTTDEKSGAFIESYDVSDLTTITRLDRIQSNPGSGVIPHNAHFINGYLVISYYRDGVTIYDVSRPNNMIEVGNYDTYTQGSGNGYDGCWGVYPWLPSGNIIASDINNGLFILGPTYTRGCYLEGKVTHLGSGIAIAIATIEILSTSITENSNNTGDYAAGTADSGTYSVVFSAPAYYSDTLTAVLTNGVVTILNVQLDSIPPFKLTGQVIESTGGNPISSAKIRIFNNDFNYDTITDASGNFTLPTFFPGSYKVLAGKWSYKTYCTDSLYIDSSSSNVIIQLDAGIYDDFTFDFGWTVSGDAPAGIWERGVPVGTSYFGSISNPNVDVSMDCSDEAYVTGNKGSSAGDDDVDDGSTILTSPEFDVTSYSTPYVNYYRWFYNGGGFSPQDDSLNVKLTNGNDTVVLETVNSSDTLLSSWVGKSFLIKSYITPTSTMRIIFETADQDTSGHLVEAGVDEFQVTNTPVGIAPFTLLKSTGNSLLAYPNPFNDNIQIEYKINNKLYEEARIILVDLRGRVLSENPVYGNSGTLTIKDIHTNGIYFCKLVNGSNMLSVVKIIKL